MKNPLHAATVMLAILLLVAPMDAAAHAARKTPKPPSDGGGSGPITTFLDAHDARHNVRYTIDPTWWPITSGPFIYLWLPGYYSYYDRSVSARLTDGESGVADKPIAFTADDGRTCSATTGADGHATCQLAPASGLRIHDSAYTATFNGDSTHTGSSDRAAIRHSTELCIDETPQAVSCWSPSAASSPIETASP
ncbi:MAG: hypothetical protein KY437_01310 [Actinobacteria bacterium]|nr:hypothetical protein [Actinomycetota bacterium]